MGDKPLSPPVSSEFKRQYTSTKYKAVYDHLKENTYAQYAFIGANKNETTFCDSSGNEQRFDTHTLSDEQINALGLSHTDKSRVKEIIEEYKKI